MARRSIRPGLTSLLTAAGVVAVPITVASPFTAPAYADAVAYLVNVTVRPGYNFRNTDDALAYGNGICDKIGTGLTYSQIMREVRRDFDTSDEYQASYLITQAANELCPALIWQLRNSAAGYQPPAPERRQRGPVTDDSS